MKQTVFRKVYVKDRLPEYSGVYFTDDGEFLYTEDKTWLHWSYQDRKCPKWFLEEIELPSAHDLQSISIKEGYPDYHPAYGAFFDGANYILNKLK